VICASRLVTSTNRLVIGELMAGGLVAGGLVAGESRFVDW
jgi:hypothetical protein